jgi:hypothetical protein
LLNYHREIGDWSRMQRRFAIALDRTSDRSEALTGIASVVQPRARLTIGQPRLLPPLASVSYSGVTLSGPTGACRTHRTIDRAFFAV